MTEKGKLDYNNTSEHLCILDRTTPMHVTSRQPLASPSSPVAVSSVASGKFSSPMSMAQRLTPLYSFRLSRNTVLVDAVENQDREEMDADV